MKSNLGIEEEEPNSTPLLDLDKLGDRWVDKLPFEGMDPDEVVLFVLIELLEERYPTDGLSDGDVEIKLDKKSTEFDFILRSEEPEKAAEIIVEAIYRLISPQSLRVQNAYFKLRECLMDYFFMYVRRESASPVNASLVIAKVLQKIYFHGTASGGSGGGHVIRVKFR